LFLRHKDRHNFPNRQGKDAKKCFNFFGDNLHICIFLHIFAAELRKKSQFRYESLPYKTAFVTTVTHRCRHRLLFCSQGHGTGL
jgi:hypothetical protein